MPVCMCLVGEDLERVEAKEGNHTVYVGHSSEYALV